jgi:L-lysine 2,3-aminomutase
VQHKYRETVLCFPSQGQTCHAYCSFCFRWPQFVGMSELKFASREVDRLVDYLQANPQVSDVLFTGGDPLIMSARHLAEYIEPLLDAGLPNLRHIRIVTKALSYWPNKFLTDDDTPDLLALFRKVGEYDDQATWLNELKPAFGEAKFFYQDELEAFYRESIDASHAEDYE